MKGQLDLGLVIEKTDEDKMIEEKYGNKFTIEKKNGDKIFFPLMKDNQRIVEGRNGKYYYLLTEKGENYGVPDDQRSL